MLVGKGIACSGPLDVFEDWYIDPTVIPYEIYAQLMTPGEFNDSGERFLTNGPFRVATELWDGQGLGNQLWAYAVTRAIAKHRNMDFAIMGWDHFKGEKFIDLERGDNLSGGVSPEGGPPKELPIGLTSYRQEKKYLLDGFRWDISPMDQDLYNCPVNTKIDGNFQSVSYLDACAEDIRSWIKIERAQIKIPENWCLIHVRGGDFKNITRLNSMKNFYYKSIDYIRSLDAEIEFKCVTDDQAYARSVLGDSVEIIGTALTSSRDPYQASHHIGGPVEVDFKLLNSANYLIIPNSSFSWWAAYLNENKKIVIAPKYWALFGTSIKTWSTFEIVTPGFTYIEENGNIYSYDECVKEREISRDFIFRQSSIGFKKRIVRDNKFLKKFYTLLLKIYLGRLIQKVISKNNL